jgi:hypothetical protein
VVRARPDFRRPHLIGHVLRVIEHLRVAIRCN